MTTMTQALGPILVSELPPIPVQPTRKPSRLATRRAIRTFEQALAIARGQELTDLLAQERAHRTVTRTLT
jgi:hypothetical protein